MKVLLFKYSYQGNGRPPAYYADILKCLCIKAYHNTSSWRAESDLKIAIFIAAVFILLVVIVIELLILKLNKESREEERSTTLDQSLSHMAQQHKDIDL